jgi:iron(III) transport system ATP-binding protein
MIMEVLDGIAKHLQVSCIMVSHDAPDMLSWADQLIIIEQGRILQQGKPKELYDQPLNEHVAGLLGEYNICDAVLVQQLTNTSCDIALHKKYVIRPEHILISAEGKGVEAVIEEVCFKGCYLIMRCRLKNHGACIRVSASDSQDFKISTSLYLNASMNRIAVIDQDNY